MNILLNNSQFETNMRIAPLFKVIVSAFLLASCEKDDFNITDFDGNVYHGVKIGNQIWMTENLRTTRYADGSAIPQISENSAWDELEADGMAYCWYDNSTFNEDVYGGLYTWAAATNGGSGNIQGICPDGWHLPSEEEWKELVIHLGGYFEAGYYLKEHGTDHWARPNPGASNSSGFTALPGGYRNIAGSFSSMGALSNFWSSTESTSSAYRLGLVAGDGDVNISGAPKESGLSVRCVKD